MNKIEKAINKLKSDIGALENYLKNRPSYEYEHSMEIELINDMQFAIKILSKQLTDRWIPVSERLPENRFYENGEPIEYNVMLRRVTNPTTLCIDNHGFWFDWRGNYYDIVSLMSYEFDVIAWQPLPEPYKESDSHGN